MSAQRPAAVPRNTPELPGITFAPTALSIDRALDFAGWTRLFDLLLYFDRAVQWWLGDAFIFGEESFGDESFQAVDESSRERLQKARWVAERVSPAQRRADLSWSHHRAVASVTDPREQAEWLERAAREGLRSGELSRLVAGRSIEPEPPAGEPERSRCPACGYVGAMEAVEDDHFRRRGGS